MEKVKDLVTKSGSTLFLKATVLGISGLVLVLCFVVLPVIYREWPIEYPSMPHYGYALVAGMGLSAIVFFAAMYQTIKLLGYIDKNEAFSYKSIKALGVIKMCALIFSGCYAAVLPIVYAMAQYEDAPGLMLMGLVFTGAPIAVAVFAAVCQRLFESVIAIKSENDLTV